MIPKSGHRFVEKGLPPRKRGSCSSIKLERDDESKRSHHALARMERSEIPERLSPHCASLHAGYATTAGGHVPRNLVALRRMRKNPPSSRTTWMTASAAT